VLAGTSSYELEDFVGAKFYCLHVLADSDQRIRIREKTLESSPQWRYDQKSLGSFF